MNKNFNLKDTASFPRLSRTARIGILVAIVGIFWMVCNYAAYSSRHIVDVQVATFSRQPATQEGKATAIADRRDAKAIRRPAT